MSGTVEAQILNIGITNTLEYLTFEVRFSNSPKIRWPPICQSLKIQTPLKNRTEPYHFNSERVRFSSPHCIQIPSNVSFSSHDLKSGQFFPLFRLTIAQQTICDQTNVHALHTREDCYSDPHCMSIF